MCNYLFVAADVPLPLLAWNKDQPSVYVTEMHETNNIVQNWVNKAYVYEIGSHIGCGCPFSSGHNWENPTPEDIQEQIEDAENFRHLAAYLEGIITISNSIVLYNAEEYWLPPVETRTLFIHEILSDRFMFNERELMILKIEIGVHSRSSAANHHPRPPQRTLVNFPQRESTPAPVSTETSMA